ncbi:MAG: serine protease Do [Candidatus Midichloriaceae bacterium]|jgi:serine protease Do
MVLISKMFSKLGIICSVMCFLYMGDIYACEKHNVSLPDIIEKLSPAVVNISTTQILNGEAKNGEFPEVPEELFRFFEEFNKSSQNNKPSKVLSLGSGFLIDDKGHIVTNNHVIDNAEEITVTIGNDEKKYEAKLVGKDKKTDLALLKIDVKKTLPYVEFGDSKSLRVGEDVIAIGNAFGFGGTVTRGIISAKGRYLNRQFPEEFIQTDASINRGNSGGPMFNMEGKVVGVNTAIVSPSGGNVGVGFAIPSNIAKTITEKLMKDGKIQRGWIGITFQPITDSMRKALNLHSPHGVIIAEVKKGAPADKAGMKMGDVIVKFNGEVVYNANKFPSIVANSDIGKPINVELLRKNKVVNVVIYIELDRSMEDLQEKEKNVNAVVYAGITVIDITQSVRDHYNIEQASNGGVLVVKIDSKSDAYRKGIQEGDVILTIGDVNISSTKQFKNLLVDAKVANNNKLTTVVLLVSSNKLGNRYIEIDI